MRNTYPVTIEPERWHHLALVREPGGVLVYLDGRQVVAAAPAAADFPTQMFHLAIGNEGRRGAAFYGRRIVRPPLSQRLDGAADPSPGRQQSGPEEMTTKILFLIPAARRLEGDPRQEPAAAGRNPSGGPIVPRGARSRGLGGKTVPDRLLDR